MSNAVCEHKSYEFDDYIGVIKHELRTGNGNSNETRNRRTNFLVHTRKFNMTELPYLQYLVFQISILVWSLFDQMIWIRSIAFYAHRERGWE